MSLCVGDRPVCRSYVYTRCCIDKIDSPDDEHKVARNTMYVENRNKYI